MKRFVLIGVGGYIAPRHLKAIKETGNILVAALDKNDSVGVLDSYFPDADFFTEFERFDRHLEKLRQNNGQHVDYVSICSPNYLHDAHVRFALRIGADAICEKPLVLNPWNITALEDIAKETKKNINTILQLRLHPAIEALKEHIDKAPDDKVFDIDLTYITSRGHWYMTSWKGVESKSGGIVHNIGIHFFDILSWIFGGVKKNIVHVYEPTRSGGFLELDRARVKWFLSLNGNDLPLVPKPGEPMTYRSLMIDGKEIDFTDGFTNLHTESYRQILAGNGFGLKDVRNSVEIVSEIRNTKPDGFSCNYHPLLKRSNVCSRKENKNHSTKPDYLVHGTSIVDDSAQIGEGTNIWHFSHIMKDVKIGKRCVLGQNVYAGPGVIIGDGCKIQNNVSIYNSVTLEDEVFCGPSCVFTNVYNPRAFIERKNEFLPTLVKKGATIGANATIVCGTTIGKYAFIGAGAVVIKDVEDYAIVVGVPTNQIGWVCRCGTKLKTFDTNNTAKCESCNCKYHLRNDILIPFANTP
jgi:UDP-N-acetyl-2-amino-2-deoxyglucuronate dehydrogenase